MKLAVVGRGKVGRTLGRAASAAGLELRLHAARSELPEMSVDLVVVAVRDAQIASVAARLSRGRPREPDSPPLAVVHCAGPLGPEALAPLAGPGVALGVMHPVISFVDDGGTLEGAAVISGDREAIGLASRLARVIGLRPVVVGDDLDRGLYHAALALAANGAAALAAVASELTRAAGIPPEEVSALIGPLLVSVGRNVERLGAVAALSGPVRRGSVSTVEAHLARLSAVAPDRLPLYRALATAQLVLARAAGEASDDDLAAIEASLAAPPVK